jgi:cytochrome b
MSLWRWLNNTDHQKTHTPVGAGIAGTVTLPVQLGVIGKKEASPAPQATAPAAARVAVPDLVQALAPAAPTVSQHAEAGADGTAVNIISNGNSASIPAKH